MGICTARSNDIQTIQSRRIDVGLKAHAQHMHNTVKMILLGPGESGKSTVFKQMKIIQDAGGFSHEECLAFIPVVHSNCISQMKVLITAATNLQISFSSKAACDAAERLLQLYQQGTSMNEEIAGIIQVLWEDSGIKTVHEMRGRKYQLNDTADYFFEHVDRISKPDYVPTHEDILRARVRSTGIEEAQFTFEQLTFTVVDVGGQRAERRKWIYCFENVRIVLFCAAISGYDQTLREDSSQNRMDEAILLFEEVTNSGYFSPETAILLFLNKQDLFEQKYPKVPLTSCFPDYTGSTIEDARKFIEERFLEKIHTNKTEAYVHHTCALNTQNMRFVITAIRKELLKDDLKQIIPSDSIL